MPVQISISRDGNAMTLQCPESEWERVRKRFNTDPESDEVIWLKGTDGETMGCRISDVLAVIYIDEETFEQMKREQQEKRAQARREAMLRSGIEGPQGPPA